MNEPSDFEVEEACGKLREFLDAADRNPRAALVASKYDQFGAQLRDMDHDQWEAAVVGTVETTDLTEAEVRNWFGRLSGKCPIDDTFWTGKELQ